MIGKPWVCLQNACCRDRERKRNSEIDAMIGHAKKREPHLQGVSFHEKGYLN